MQRSVPLLFPRTTACLPKVRLENKGQSARPSKRRWLATHTNTPVIWMQLSIFKRKKLHEQGVFCRNFATCPILCDGANNCEGNISLEKCNAPLHRSNSAREHSPIRRVDHHFARVEVCQFLYPAR